MAAGSNPYSAPEKSYGQLKHNDSHENLVRWVKLRGLKNVKKMKNLQKIKTHRLTTPDGLTNAVKNEQITFVRKKCRRIAFFDQNFEKVWFFSEKLS